MGEIQNQKGKVVISAKRIYGGMEKMHWNLPDKANRACGFEIGKELA